MFVYDKANYAIYEDNGIVLGKIVDRMTTAHPLGTKAIEWLDCVTVWSEDPLAVPRQAVNKAKALAGIQDVAEAKWVYLVLTGRINNWTYSSLTDSWQVSFSDRYVYTKPNLEVMSRIFWSGSQYIPFIRSGHWFYNCGPVITCWADEDSREE